MSNETVKPGWYDDVENGIERRWDGDQWTGETRDAFIDLPPTKSRWAPSDYILYGILGSFVGTLLLYVGLDDPEVVPIAFAGSIVLGLASIVLLVGIVSKGVSVGMRNADRT